jgi:hypothetical protein
MIETEKRSDSFLNPTGSAFDNDTAFRAGQLSETRIVVRETAGGTQLKEELCEQPLIIIPLQ